MEHSFQDLRTNQRYLCPWCQRYAPRLRRRPTCSYRLQSRVHCVLTCEGFMWYYTDSLSSSRAFSAKTCSSILWYSPLSPALTDCAVCEEGFTSGLNYECTECPERESLSTVLLTGVAVVVTLSSAVLLSYLVRVVGDGEREETINRQGFWKGKMSSLYKIIDSRGSSSALKTTVVVWQIISQVCESSA